MNHRRPARDQRGAATAELAMALPMLLAVTVGLVWLLAVGSAQIRTVDAARETARAVARGDDVAAAVARGEQVAPAGSRISVESSTGQVTVVVTGRVRGPGGMFSLPGAAVSAQAVALDEEAPP